MNGILLNWLAILNAKHHKLNIIIKAITFDMMAIPKSHSNGDGDAGVKPTNALFIPFFNHLYARPMAFPGCLYFGANAPLLIEERKRNEFTAAILRDLFNYDFSNQSIASQQKLSSILYVSFQMPANFSRYIVCDRANEPSEDTQ